MVLAEIDALAQLIKPSWIGLATDDALESNRTEHFRGERLFSGILRLLCRRRSAEIAPRPIALRAGVQQQADAKHRECAHKHSPSPTACDFIPQASRTHCHAIAPK